MTILSCACLRLAVSAPARLPLPPCRPPPLKVMENNTYYSPEGFLIPVRAGRCQLWDNSKLLSGWLGGPASWFSLALHPLPPRIQIDGGDPLLLDGNVVLCSRSDDPAGRHYDGRLAYLSLYDTALDDVQIG